MIGELRIANRHQCRFLPEKQDRNDKEARTQQYGKGRSEDIGTKLYESPGKDVEVLVKPRQAPTQSLVVPE